MKILNTILLLITTAFHKIFYGQAQYVIQFTCLVSQAIQNPALDIFVLATENKIDDTILAAFRTALKKLMVEFNGEPVNDADIKDSDIVESIKSMYKNKNIHFEEALLQKLAALMYKDLRGEETTQVEADTIMQLAYAKYKQKGLIKVQGEVTEQPETATEKEKA